MSIDSKKKEMLQRGTAFFPIQYYCSNTASPLYNLPVHWHNECEMIHILDGEHVFFIDGEEITLKKGSLCVIQDGILHGDGANKSTCRYESVVFDFNMIRNKNYAHDAFLEDISSHKVVLNKVIPLKNKEAVTEVENMFLAMRREPVGYELLTVARLLFIFGYIKNNNFFIEDEKVLDRSRVRSDQLKAVFNLIKQNYGSVISLDDMAASAGMSPKYFCRVFREMTHRTPVEYLNAFRVDQACNQLRAGKESLIDVAYNCGFNDFSYFIKTFKRYKGMTPHKYRSFDMRMADEIQPPPEIHENEYSDVNS